MKNLVSFIFLLALLVSGCSQEEMLKGVTSASSGRIFTTSFEQKDSRTFVKDGYLSRWTANDRISLFDSNTQNLEYKFDGETGDSEGTFSMVNISGGTGSSLTSNYAVYPYSKDVQIAADGKITTTLPSEQHYAENSFGVGDNTMVAVTQNTDDTFLTFKNVCGGLKFQLYGDDVTVKSVILLGNNGELISGNATIKAAYDENPIVTMADDATDYIILDCGEKGVKIGTSAEEATVFWLVVPPITFEKGVTVLVTDMDGKVFTQTIDKELCINRNVVKSIAAVKANMEPITPKLAYISDTAELEEWSEGLFSNDGSYYMAKPSDDNSCIVTMGNFATEENAIIYIDDNRQVREVFFCDNIFTFNNYTETSVDISCFDENGVRITETVARGAGTVSRSHRSNEQQANGINLGLNMWSIKESVSDILTSKNIYKQIRGWETYTWNWFNAIGAAFELAGFSESDLYNNKATEVIGIMDNLITIGELGFELIKSLKEKDPKLKLRPGAGPAGWAITAWLDFYATYLELKDEKIENVYGDCIASIADIEYENNTLNIDLRVSGYESTISEFECGVIVKKSNLPFAPPVGRFPSNAETKMVSGDGNYSFSVGGIEEGESYWCYPFLIEINRISYWIGFIGEMASPFVRYGKAVKYEPEDNELREALIKLYESTNGDNWTRKTNWCSDKPVEQWSGVSKLGDKQYSINLNGNNLTGKIEQTFPNNLNIQLYLFNNQLTSLEITDSNSLTELNCNINQLTSLNVSGCTSLTKLYCNDNQLTSLDVSDCAELTFIQCLENQFETLDFSGCTSLTNLPFLGNLYTSLDVSGCASLTQLYCDNKQLTSLDVSGCASLTELYCFNNQLTSLDVSGCASLTQLNCCNNQLTTLNVSECTELSDLLCNNNQLTSLNVSGCAALDRLQCVDNQLISLDVSGCASLTQLNCCNNQLTTLNVSGCTELSDLLCNNNQLTSLNVSGCTALDRLQCVDNQLISLDVSGCVALTELYFNDNQLTSLDVSGCASLTQLYCDNKQLTSLDVTGCTSLTELYCFNNQLTSLDVSGCASLTRLNCCNNQLTSLNVSGCTELSDLLCNNNQLTSLNVSDCTALDRLQCVDNQLTSLDVSGSIALRELWCTTNQLTYLNVSGCTALTGLWCANNKITSMIPEWFSQLSTFNHDIRFRYWTESVPDGDGGYVTIDRYEDRGIGWWYPGEPGKYEHSPN